MTYEPKAGDKVTCSLLPGEWIIVVPEPVDVRPGNRHWWVRGDTGLGGRGDVCVPAATLTKIPYPPEPPVGEVVWAMNRFYMHHPTGWVSPDTPGPWCYANWSDIAADAVPVVPVNKVADWLFGHSCCGPEQVSEFTDEFGWDKKEGY